MASLPDMPVGPSYTLGGYRAARQGNISLRAEKFTRGAVIKEFYSTEQYGVKRETK